MFKNRRDEELVQTLLDRLTLRAKSLIVTVYGDAILPHGGTTWLGSLINLVEDLGLSERMVRTAVFRLSKDEWLTSNQIGRRSYYSLSEVGRRRFEAAQRRIYGGEREAWNGEWTLVLTNVSDIDVDTRDAVKRELVWQGFGNISPNVLAHPAADVESVKQILQDHRVTDQMVVMRAKADDSASLPPLRDMTARCWDLEGLGREYQAFLDTFRPVWRALESDTELNPAICFLVRILLIHDYRRVCLKDPMLPEELLPADWAGSAARALCRNLYRLVEQPAEDHLMTVLETADGPLPEAAPYFYRRFGGLSRP